LLNDFFNFCNDFKKYFFDEWEILLSNDIEQHFCIKNEDLHELKRELENKTDKKQELEKNINNIKNVVIKQQIEKDIKTLKTNIIVLEHDIKNKNREIKEFKTNYINKRWLKC